MEADLEGPQRFRFVYGTQDARTADALRERAFLVAQRMFGADSDRVSADRESAEAELAAGPVVLLGSPRENAWTRALAPALPVEFTERGFRWRGAAYERPGDVLSLAWPNPLAPKRLLLLVVANSAAALGARGTPLFGGDDWRIVRDGELARSGTFAQSAAAPWRYDPALDRDREAERARWQRALRTLGGGELAVRAPAGSALAPTALRTGRALLARLDAAGLGAGIPPRPVTLTLYGSIEDKGRFTGSTRPEDVDPGGANAALAAGRDALDLWSVAAARLLAIGASPASRFLVPTGAWWAGRLEGEPLARAVARLYFGRALPAAAEAATRSPLWRSPLVWTPARALLARAVWESAPAPSRRRALLSLLQGDPPGTLDSLCAAAGVRAARVEERYRALADSLARGQQRALALRRPRPWRPADGFQGGVCLAHALSLERGYASAACARELAELRRAGASWVSLSPVADLPDPRVPVLLPSAAGGEDEESDEAVAEAAARARALGLRVWLAPQLWTRGWVGQLEFGATDWERFFDRYGEWLLHCSLLADRERIEGLMVGRELVTSTAHDPERWRALIGRARDVYGGTLGYAANWDEVGQVPFWDALDVIGVSFGFPLADRPSREPAVLRAGATRGLAELAVLGRRWGRPVLIAQIGYASRPEAPVRPWEEGGPRVDVEAQAACYRAALDAMEGQDWLAGVLWWKWLSAAGEARRPDASFSCRGKPAEAVLRESLRRWRDRVVRSPAGLAGASP